MSNKREIYVSVDVEANGLVPPDSSMLSLGAAAFIYGNSNTLDMAGNSKPIATFSVNLETLPNSIPDPDTTKWWSENQAAYDATRINTIEPKLAMLQFHDWLTKLDGKCTFVGYPATYDFMWVYYYLMHFVGDSPFSFSGLDIKTYGMALMKTDYRSSTKRNMPKRWFSDDKHNHHALTDSIGQGKLFMNMLRENLSKRS
jgi:3' exoribonuclease, RNase T-like